MHVDLDGECDEAFKFEFMGQKMLLGENRSNSAEVTEMIQLL